MNRFGRWQAIGGREVLGALVGTDRSATRESVRDKNAAWAAGYLADTMTAWQSREGISSA